MCLLPLSEGFFCAKNMGRERLHVITHPDKLSLPVKGVIVEAHPDDKAMAEIDGSLAQKAGITVVSLTDGAARDLPHFTPQQLRHERRPEQVNSVRILGGAQTFGADLPDGLLSKYIAEGAIFLDEVVRNEKPDFLIAPHPRDPHPDHRAAAEITKIVANGEIPIYYMSTITGVDYDGNEVIPTHYTPLTRRDVRRRRQSYLAHTSQVKNLSYSELRDVFRVLDMPRQRGRDIGERFAGGLIFEPPRDGQDPLADIYKNSIKIISPSF